MVASAIIVRWSSFCHWSRYRFFSYFKQDELCGSTYVSEKILVVMSEWTSGIQLFLCTLAPNYVSSFNLMIVTLRQSLTALRSSTAPWIRDWHNLIWIFLLSYNSNFLRSWSDTIVLRQPILHHLGNNMTGYLSYLEWRLMRFTRNYNTQNQRRLSKFSGSNVSTGSY